MPTDDLAPWRALRKTVEIRNGPVHPVKVAAIRQFEAETGIRLPAGYRAFVRVFGPGTFDDGEANTTVIRVPRAEGMHASKRRSDLASDLELYRERQWQQDPLLIRLVPFADTFGGDRFAWDPEDVTDPDGPEYAIYCNQRDTLETVLVARCFYELVTEISLNREGFCRAVGCSPINEKPEQRVFYAHGTDRPEAAKKQAAKRSRRGS